MIKKTSLSITLIVILVSLLIACQPETAGLKAPSPTSEMAKLPSVVAKTASSQSAWSTPEEATPKADSTDQEPANPESDQDNTTSPAETPETLADVPLEAGPLVNLAKQELAEKLDVPTEDIIVISVTAVVWPDASLGCPQSGIEYAQVLTSGYQILLSYQGVQSEYHSDDSSNVIECVGDFLKPLPELPFDPGEIKDGEPWMPVD